jgi:hypothetical protein
MVKMRLENILNDNSSFADLNDFVYLGYIELKEKCFYSRRLYLAMVKNPLSQGRVEELCSNGWRLVSDSCSINCGGICDHDLKEITISRDLDTFYSVDKTVCHEIVHAYYGKISNDGSPGVRFCDKEELIAGRNNAIVEWYARKIRATPNLLAAIWKGFNITPRIYDRASLIATQHLIKPQLFFPDITEYLKQTFNFTLMD